MPEQCTAGLQATWSSLLLRPVCAELIRANVDKTLALTISFGRISREQFWGAIQERLEPLMLQVRLGANAQHSSASNASCGGAPCPNSVSHNKLANEACTKVVDLTNSCISIVTSLGVSSTSCCVSAKERRCGGDGSVRQDI